MKTFFKYIAILVSFLLLSLNSVSTAFSSEDVIQESSDNVEIENNDEVIEYKYLVFVHENCGHCKAVEAFIEEYGIEGHIELKQLKDNDENMALLEQYWTDFEIEGGYGWPMLVRLGDDSIYALGDTPIMDLLATDLSLDYEVSTVLENEEQALDIDAKVEEKKRDTVGDKIFLYIGGIFMLSIIGYGIYTFFIED